MIWCGLPVTEAACPYCCSRVWLPAFLASSEASEYRLPETLASPGTQEPDPVVRQLLAENPSEHDRRQIVRASVAVGARRGAGCTVRRRGWPDCSRRATGSLARRLGRGAASALRASSRRVAVANVARDTPGCGARRASRGCWRMALRERASALHRGARSVGAGLHGALGCRRRAHRLAQLSAGAYSPFPRRAPARRGGADACHRVPGELSRHTPRRAHGRARQRGARARARRVGACEVSELRPVFGERAAAVQAPIRHGKTRCSHPRSQTAGSGSTCWAPRIRFTWATTRRRPSASISSSMART